jgi:hypothetical protein
MIILQKAALKLDENKKSSNFLISPFMSKTVIVT